MDTSAAQKHRPSRQARPPQGVWQSVLPLSSLRSRVSGCGNPLPFRGIRILSRFAFRMTSRLAIANTQGAQIYFRLPVIAVRVSGGHLCEAEAPTEPAGETAVRCVAIRSPSPSSLRSRVNGCGNPFSLKGYTDSFTLRVQNDKPFGNLQTHKACGMTAKIKDPVCNTQTGYF